MPRAALPLDPPCRQGLQADQAGRRLLARRRQARAAAAHLRHGLGDEGGPRRLCAASGGGGKARPPPPGPPDGALPHAGRGPRHGVLAPQGLGAVAGDRGLYAPAAERGRLCRGQDAPGTGPQVLGGLGPLGEVPAQHVRVRDGRGRGAVAQADELPRSRADLRPGPALLPRAAAAHGRVRCLPPLRAVGLAARADAGARLRPGRRPHLLPRGPDRRGDSGLHRAGAQRPRRPRHADGLHQPRHPARGARRHR